MIKLKTIERKSKQEAIKKLKNLQPNLPTILYVLKQCFNKNTDFSKYGMLTLNLLFHLKNRCFKNVSKKNLN